MRLTLFPDQAPTLYHLTLKIKSRIRNGVLIQEFSLKMINLPKLEHIAHALYNSIHLLDMS